MTSDTGDNIQRGVIDTDSELTAHGRNEVHTTQDLEDSLSAKVDKPDSDNQEDEIMLHTFDKIDSRTALKFKDDVDVHETGHDLAETQTLSNDPLGAKAEIESHISIDSDSDPNEGDIEVPDPYPWRSFPWSRKQRATVETWFSLIHDAPWHGSWQQTEVLQKAKDEQMLHYIADFPLKSWVIGLEQATQVYNRMLERSKWRSMNVRIYGNQRLRESMPASAFNAHPHLQHQAYSNPFPLPPTHQHPPQASNAQQTRHAQFAQHHTTAQQPFGTPHQHPIYFNQHLYGAQNHRPHHMHSHPQPVPLQVHNMQLPRQEAHGGTIVLDNNVHEELQVDPDVVSKRPLTQIPRWQQFESAPTKNQVRKREHTSPQIAPPLPPRTPPYEDRPRPSFLRSLNRTGRGGKRKLAETIEFPWNRKDVDFKKEKIAATWSDSIYPPETVLRMEETRTRNHPIIEGLDMESTEQQRKHVAAKRANRREAEEGHEAEDDNAEHAGKKERAEGVTPGTDPYHSGTFQFASEEDQTRAGHIGTYHTPDTLLNAGEAGKLDWNLLQHIYVCWNPGRKGLAQHLEQAKFSVRDALATRKSLAEKPVWTREAAERLIDFCPDLLWRGALLRVTSEAGLGNKDIRDRFCRNGCWCDKATMTKRIGAALGQKQTQSKNKDIDDIEYAWYQDNIRDFDDYINFFGKRQSHRNQAKSSRKRIRVAAGESSDSAVPVTLDAVIESSDRMEANEGSGSYDGPASGSDEDEDAVSLQDSDDLSDSVEG